MSKRKAPLAIFDAAEYLVEQVSSTNYNLQWQAVLGNAQQLADINPQQHERTLFMVSALYAMYLRISELVSSERWTPSMNDFHLDSNDRWWFTTVGKGNKERDIAVSDAMIKSLKRWRKYLG